MFGTNLDFRYEAGFPTMVQAQGLGVRWARVLSLPSNEYWAGRLLAQGCQVVGVYTGESDEAGKYVMTNASIIQICNEPLMGGDASWPSGNVKTVIATWLRIRDLVWAKRGNWFPLMGPGIWCQDFAKWERLAFHLEGVTTAAVHVYPEPSGQNVDDVVAALDRYRAVRPDLALACTEWNDRWPRAAPIAQAIDRFCSMRCWYTWNDPGQPHLALAGTPELGILLTL